MVRRLIELAVSHARTTILVMLGIVLFGIVARVSIYVETEPTIEEPFFTITTVMEGISPEDATRLLILPLELELKAIEDVKEVYGTGAEHMAIVGVEFAAEANLDAALGDVREAVNRAKPKFPSAAEEPVVAEKTSTGFPVVQVNFVGPDAPENVLFKVARDVRERIELLPEVKHAVMQGQREEFLEIVIEPSQLLANEISIEMLANALRRNNRVIPAGAVETQRGSVSVKIPGVIESPSDILSLPVRVDGQTIVTLSDVATVRRTFKDRTSYSSANGNQAITLFVYRRADANLIETVDVVREAVEEYRPSLPNTVNMFYSSDTSIFVRNQVTELQGNIVTSLVLVLIVVFSAMGFRSSLIVTIAIPVSFLFALIFLWLLGHSFNFMVMFGMILALGMLIDGAIVVTEDAERRVASGDSHKEAYIAASTRMFLPVVASTATTLAAFVPLMFWPGTAGEFMGFLPITVFAVLVGALLFALFFVPVLGGTLLTRRRAATAAAVSSDETIWDTDLERFKGVSRIYRYVLSASVRHPIFTIVVMISIVWAIFAVHGSRGHGVMFFNENDPGYAQIYIRARGNLSIDEAFQLVSEVEHAILEIPGIEGLNTYVTTGASQAEGQRMRFTGGATADIIGTMFLETYGSNEREQSGTEILEEVRRRASAFSGLVVEIQPFQGELTSGKPIAIQFSSSDRSRLEPVLRQVNEYLTAEVDGLRDIESTLPIPGVEWEIEVDRAEAGLYGVDVSTIGLAVQLVTNGSMLGEYRPDDADDALDIRVRFPESERGIDSLDEMYLVTSTGPVPISNFVTRKAASPLQALERRDQMDVHMIRADVAPGILANTKVNEIQAWLDQADLDPLVDIRFRGAQEDQQESEEFLTKAFSFAILLMFVLLVTQYNSIYQSFLTMLAIVMSTAGVFLGLIVTGQPFSIILSGVGVVALAGIVVNNNIVLIDTFNIGRREHPEIDVPTLIVLTGLQRLRPVLLTTITTIIGLLPLASHQSIDFVNRAWIVGGELSGYWVPLAQAVVFGLSFATVLTLIVTPSLLVLPDLLKTRGSTALAFGRQFFRRGKRASAA